jgi:hypothetical protein
MKNVNNFKILNDLSIKPNTPNGWGPDTNIKRNILPYKNYQLLLDHTINKFIGVYETSIDEYQNEINSNLNSFIYQTILVDPASLPGYRHVQDLFDRSFFNYSTNPEHFEKACFHRWFAINSLTASLSENDYVCILDTDFLIGMPPSDLHSLCQSKFDSLSLNLIAEWDNDIPIAVGPEITIMTKSFLYDFCKFLLTDYFSISMKPQLLAEYFERIGNGLEGGICDMRALATYVRLKHIESSFNLRQISSPLLIKNFNSFLSSASARNESWNIIFKWGLQELQQLGHSTQLIGVHFQGSAKQYMDLLCDCKHAVQINSSVCVEYLEKKTSSSHEKSRLYRTLKRLKNGFGRSIFSM